jgi:hypothetical protein
MPEARRHHPDLWQQARPPAAGKSAVQRERLVAPLGYRSEGRSRLEAPHVRSIRVRPWSYSCPSARTLGLKLPLTVTMLNLAAKRMFS